MPKHGVSNNLLGDLPAHAKQRRDVVEDALASLYRVMIDLEELSLRIDQAIRRASVVSPVLVPAQERLAQIQTRLSALHHSLGECWSAGQSHRWE